MLELSIADSEKLKQVAHALSTDSRIQMIQQLNHASYSVHELAARLKIPVSTAAANVNVLQEAGLIVTELRPASRGALKMCTRNFDDIRIVLNQVEQREQVESSVLHMPIGHYVEFSVSPTCGMANEQGDVLNEDDPVQFYQPERVAAELIWTRAGYLEYKFPFAPPKDRSITSIAFSCELCSEAPNYDHNWPSDITVWMNGIDIGTWTSPSDFGDRAGALNPAGWFQHTRTQYGSLKRWEVNKNEALLDFKPIKAVSIDQLQLDQTDYLSVRIGIKEDAEHKGGFNLFGEKFGDYAQALKLEVYFQEKE